MNLDLYFFYDNIREMLGRKTLPETYLEPSFMSLEDFLRAETTYKVDSESYDKVKLSALTSLMQKKQNLMKEKRSTK